MLSVGVYNRLTGAVNLYQQFQPMHLLCPQAPC